VTHLNDYTNKLNATKASYPFHRWRSSGLDQYTPQACEAFSQVFDHLISDLNALGINAKEAAKLAAFETAVLALNVLDETDESLIETGEREDLCELINTIATVAGLDPSKYGDGEGPASEWREW
jgi:hypothetical protein